MTLYGIHEASAIGILHPGEWCIFTHELGHDPGMQGGFDYSPWAAYNVIARLNNGYHPNGTLPEPRYYPDFAARVANWVEASIGCHRWIIGNEPNLSIERPNGIAITPEGYADCYDICWAVIHSLPGHEYDEVIVAAVGPWNVESGDWIEYLIQVLGLIQHCDGLAVHTYTHGSDPALVTSDEKMASMPDRFYQFRAYRDILDLIADIPVYITETCQLMPWADVNSGWVQAAYKEIDDWNQANKPKICCLCLYRWPKFDDKFIEGKADVLADLDAARTFAYSSCESEETMGLVNGNFEGAFAQYPGYSTAIVAEGWAPFWQPQIEGDEGWENRMPEYKKATAADLPTGARVHDGQQAQQWFTFYGTHKGGVYQRVQVAAGKTVTVSAWCAAWSGDDDDLVSGPKFGNLRMRLGIDATGGTDWKSAQVAWTDFAFSYDAWKQLSLAVVPSNGYVTVFLYSECEYPVKHNDVYWDGVTLTIEEGPEPPEPPTGEGVDAFLAGIQIDLRALDAKIAAYRANLDNIAIRALPL